MTGKNPNDILRPDNTFRWANANQMVVINPRSFNEKDRLWLFKEWRSKTRKMCPSVLEIITGICLEVKLQQLKKLASYDPVYVNTLIKNTCYMWKKFITSKLLCIDIEKELTDE